MEKEYYLDKLYDNYLEKKKIYDFITNNNMNLNNNIFELQKNIDKNNNILNYYQNIYIKENLTSYIKKISNYCNNISKLQKILINDLISNKFFYYINYNIIIDLKYNIDNLQDLFYQNYKIKKRIKKMNYSPQYSDYLFNIALDNIIYETKHI